MKKKLRKKIWREMAKLERKINSLTEYLYGISEEERLSKQDESLLWVQLNAMATYYSILELRYDNG